MTGDTAENDRPIWPQAVGKAKTIAAAMTATVARSRSGASERIMPSTACATTATATTFKPRSQPPPSASPNVATPWANSTSAIAEGRVKPAQAIKAPG